MTLLVVASSHGIFKSNWFSFCQLDMKGTIFFSVLTLIPKITLDGIDWVH